MSTQQTQTSKTLNLWQTAYEQLGAEERSILSTKHISTGLKDTGDHSNPNSLISAVIQLTEEQYEEHQQNNGKIRQFSQRIINAALSFKEVISVVTAADSTHHAAAAWTIVLLGLTMTKNQYDLQDALLESSMYLADVLTQCAYVEDKYYAERSSIIKDDLGNAIVRLYRAILQYTAQIRKAHDPSLGRKLSDCVTAITGHPLKELKASVENEKGNIFRWIGVVEHLNHEAEAEKTLCRIDKLAESLKHLIEQFSLVNLRVAEGALYDSYINEEEDFCLPNTRTELLSQISNWVESSDSKGIFWLNGMAGTGKSTIARTVANFFKERGQLGATFFFKEGEVDCDNARYLISTVIRQLVTRHRQLVPGVLKAIEDDPNISTKFLKEQFDKLLLRPLLMLHLNQSTTTVIVIDALDECDQNDIELVLQLLFKLKDVQSLHLRIFLTSGPGLPIRFGFKQNDYQDLVLHELPRPVIEHDVRLFLQDRLSKTQGDDDSLLSANWPGDD
ncbi:hypothetical protein FQN57_003638, partial [Myotisia sp. PD_48]